MSFTGQSSEINVSQISQVRRPRGSHGRGLFHFDEAWFAKLRSQLAVAEVSPRAISAPQKAIGLAVLDVDALTDDIAHWGYCAVWDAYDRQSNPYGLEMPYADPALAKRWDKGWLIGRDEIENLEKQDDHHGQA